MTKHSTLSSGVSHTRRTSSIEQHPRQWKGSVRINADTHQRHMKPRTCCGVVRTGVNPQLERACIHEVPFDILKPCDEIQDADLREATRASLLGNGWHMGAFLVVLFMLIQLGGASPPDFCNLGTRLDYLTMKYTHDHDLLEQLSGRVEFSPSRES